MTGSNEAFAKFNDHDRALEALSISWLGPQNESSVEAGVEPCKLTIFSRIFCP
jgi:hypothetical protein